MAVNSKNYDLSIDAGQTYSLAITVENTNLTGYSARCQFRRNISSSTVVYDGTTVNGKIVLTDAANGVLTLNLTDTETSALSGIYVYDLEIVSGSGQVTRILQGSVVISPEVTR